MHVKSGMEVVVITGKDKGKKGKVLQVFPKLNKVVVEGVNLRTRHLKSRRQGETGQKVEFAMPIHASNVKATTEEKPKASKKVKKA